MPAALFLRLFLPYAAGNFAGSLYRSVNAVVAPDIIAEFLLSAEDMGLLTSVFFLLYAGVQIPLGIALDRFGARRVTAVLVMIAASGAALFSLASDFATLLAARAVMGLGISVAFMGALKAMVEWMPADKLPISNSLIMMSGGLGVMGATMPVQFALHFTDWHGVFLAIAALSVLIAGAIFAGPEQVRGRAASGVRGLRGVASVFTNREFLRIVPLGSSAQGVNMAMSGLWAGPWLRDVSGLSRDEAAAILFGMAAMITISVLFIGWLSARLARAGIPIMAVACAAMSGFIVFESLIALDVGVSPWALWLPYSFCATGPVLVYAVLARTFSADLAGRVNTAYNFTTFVMVFVIQWGMGAIIDLWPPLADGRFAPEGYRLSLALFVAVQLCAFAWLLVAPRARAER